MRGLGDTRSRRRHRRARSSRSLAPLIRQHYWVSALLTQMLFLGIVAASLIFLNAYGGMVSLAQVSIFGIAGFVLGNATTTGNTKGMNLGWNPWLGVVLGIAIAIAVALLFGALASRSVGIYFLMITLTYSVIANLFFGRSPRCPASEASAASRRRAWSATSTRIRTGSTTSRSSPRLRSTSLLRYIVRTPFGLTLQGLRDDPIRMSSLGYAVALHRRSRSVSRLHRCDRRRALRLVERAHRSRVDRPRATIDVLVIAVIGGLYRLEGAWVGALVLRHHQQLLAADQLHRRALPHAHRRDLPLDRAGVAGRLDRALGTSPRSFLGASPRADRRLPIEVGQGEPASERRLPASDAEASRGKRSTFGSMKGTLAQRRATNEFRKGRRRKLIPLAVLAALGAAAIASSATPARRRGRRSRSPSCPTVRGHSERSTIRIWPGSCPRCRSSRARKPKDPNKPRNGWTGGSIGGHPLKLVGIGCWNDTRRQGDQGDQAPHGAVGRGHHDRPALG